MERAGEYPSLRLKQHTTKKPTPDYKFLGEKYPPPQHKLGVKRPGNRTTVLLVHTMISQYTGEWNKFLLQIFTLRNAENTPSKTTIGTIGDSRYTRGELATSSATYLALDFLILTPVAEKARIVQSCFDMQEEGWCTYLQHN